RLSKARPYLNRTEAFPPCPYGIASGKLAIRPANRRSASEKARQPTRRLRQGRTSTLSVEVRFRTELTQERDKPLVADCASPTLHCCCREGRPTSTGVCGVNTHTERTSATLPVFVCH